MKYLIHCFSIPRREGCIVWGRFVIVVLDIASYKGTKLTNALIFVGTYRWGPVIFPLPLWCRGKLMFEFGPFVVGRLKAQPVYAGNSKMLSLTRPNLVLVCGVASMQRVPECDSMDGPTIHAVLYCFCCTWCWAVRMLEYTRNWNGKLIPGSLLRGRLKQCDFSNMSFMYNVVCTLRSRRSAVLCNLLSWHF